MQDEIAKMKELEKEKIPSDIDYDKINNIAYEAKGKIEKNQPRNFWTTSQNTWHKSS